MNLRLRDAVRTLPPGSFAFVMATGIVSTAFLAVGWELPSGILLAIAIGGLALLAMATGWRLAAHRQAVTADAVNPAKAFGYFTIVAGINVVGVRLFTPETPLATVILAIVSVPLWLLLTYGVPAALMLRRSDASAASEVNGSWFLWVVGTQSLATAAAAIAPLSGNQALAAIAVALWGVGVMLYVILATLVTLRLLTVRSEPLTLGASYWIYMGATAITVLAGSRILVLSDELPIMAATSGIVSGLTFVLWAFGVWWVPLLIIFGIWRHAVRRVPLRYESELWSIVFPLGMYSVASIHFGTETDLPLVVTMGEVGVWIAGVAWLAVAAAMVAALASTLRVPAR
ncbi:MAG TPA: tellurite resistance/C4-dicarboxylate transporter family protein [Homoserinimonas sp.]|nr:tellurite resistance/C4-dicarboxylate transporter family protein [Homoserinimonas sp.]